MNDRLCKRVEEIYESLDLQVRTHRGPAGVCEACGRCCDFESFDHRLFVTGAELAYFAAKTGGRIKPMLGGRCPYNVDGRCTVYEHRFAGCRIFCCRGSADFQSRLSESALTKLKAVCEELHIPYRYRSLQEVLTSTV